MEIEALQRAVDLIGGQSQMARELSAIVGRRIRQGHVWKWLNVGKRLPAEYAIPIELVTGGVVSRHDLRPDIYPDEAA